MLQGDISGRFDYLEKLLQSDAVEIAFDLNEDMVMKFRAALKEAGFAFEPISAVCLPPSKRTPPSMAGRAREPEMEQSPARCQYFDLTDMDAASQHSVEANDGGSVWCEDLANVKNDELLAGSTGLSEKLEVHDESFEVEIKPPWAKWFEGLMEKLKETPPEEEAVEAKSGEAVEAADVEEKAAEDKVHHNEKPEVASLTGCNVKLRLLDADDPHDSIGLVCRVLAVPNELILMPWSIPLPPLLATNLRALACLLC